MVRSVPSGVLILTALVVLLSAYLAWTRRSQHPEAYPARAWSIFEDFALSALLLMMVSTAVIQVLVRFLLSDFLVIAWTEELAILSMIWLAFFSAAAITREYGHIAFDLVYDLLPARVQRLMLLLGSAVTVAVLLPVAWYGYQDAKFLDILMTVSLGLPLAAFGFVVPVILPLIVLFTIVRLVQLLRGKHVDQAGEGSIE